MDSSKTADRSEIQTLRPLEALRLGRSVTVIVPVYNEQERIADTLYKIKDYLEQQPYRSDVLVVDDGSSDLTSEIVKFVDIYGDLIKSQSSGTLMENGKNVGKGYSVAKGLSTGEGDIIVFTDADLSVPIDQLDRLLGKFNEGFDVVIGSRNIDGATVAGRPWHREVVSRTFNLLARCFGLLTVHDSQCGFKAYRRGVARRVAGEQKTYGFCFDIEHLYIARKLGYRVAEVPVNWEHDDGSTLRLINDSIDMFIDLLRIRWLHRGLQRDPCAPAASAQPLH